MCSCLIDMCHPFTTTESDWGIEPMYQNRLCKDEMAFIWPANKPKPPGHERKRGFEVKCREEPINL